MRTPLILLLAFGLSGCVTASSGAPETPPDAKALVLTNKGQLWKDPDSIKNASISEPFKSALYGWYGWQVCVRVNAKNDFGAYSGETDSLVGITSDGRAEVVHVSAQGACADNPHVPFPALEGRHARRG